MRNDPGWWSDWLIGLLIASGILLIFKGGIVLTILLWVVYLLNGWKTVQSIPRQENIDEFVGHLIIGVIVVIVSIAINIAVLFN